MNVTALPDADLFRSQPLRGLPEAARVDRKKRMIYGAKAMQAGPLNDGDMRPWKVDNTTLSQLVELVNQRNSGVKMRFAHPNMSRDGMGRHLGRAANARVETPDDAPPYVAIDVALAEFATRSPQGNLADHVLDLAEQAPEDFGLSIAPLLDREEMGKIEPDEKGLKPIRLKGLRAIDFVDEPAATTGGLFSLDSDHLADLPAQVTHVLDTFFADSPAEVIRARFGEFLTTYLANRGEPMTTQTAETKPVETPAETPAAPAATQLEQQQAAAELDRRSQVLALCKLAKVDDATRDLMLAAGFDGKAAQDYLNRSGFFASQNPPVSEAASDPAEKKTPTIEEQFGAEWDAHQDVFSRMGVGRDEYIASRKLG